MPPAEPNSFGLVSKQDPIALDLAIQQDPIALGPAPSTTQNSFGFGLSWTHSGSVARPKCIRCDCGARPKFGY
jgi:hypothetical protein